MKNRNLMFPLFLLPVLALLSGCATQEPSLPTGPDAEVTSEGLVRVENSRVDEALMRPDVDFTRFTGIMIDTLDLSNVKVIQPSNSVRSAGNRKWELTDEDRAYLQNLFQEKMDKYIFDRGGYTRARSSRTGRAAANGCSRPDRPQCTKGNQQHWPRQDLHPGRRNNQYRRRVVGCRNRRSRCPLC